MSATFFVVNGLDGSNASTQGHALCKGLLSHLSETLILLNHFGGGCNVGSEESVCPLWLMPTQCKITMQFCNHRLHPLAVTE